MANIGIIGLGRMGARHIEAAELGGHTVVGLLDNASLPFALEARPALASLRVDSLERLAAAKPQAVVVSTTAPSHGPLLQALMDQGINRVVLEKPMTSNPAEAATLLALVKEHAARVVVNHGRRYSPNFQLVSQDLDGDGEFGRLRAVIVTQGGGGLGCLGIHYLDLCNQLFRSAPTRVVAALTAPESPNPRGAHFEDPGGTVMLMYAGGGRGIVEMGDDIGVLGQIELRFEYGVVRISNELEPWELLCRAPAARELPKTAYGAPLQPRAFTEFVPFGAVDAALCALNDVLSDAPEICGIENGAQAMYTLAAVHQSHLREKVIEMPLGAADLDIDINIP